MSHASRYARGSEENEPDRTWSKLMHAHIGKMIDYRKSLGEEDPLDPKITGQMMDRFKEILEIGKKEYEDVPANAYYRDGYNLWKRMYEKPDDYTLFLTDKSIPATNNAAERCAREYKRASIASMGYRSREAHINLCDCLTILETDIKRGENLFEKSKEYFAKEKPHVSGTKKPPVTGVC